MKLFFFLLLLFTLISPALCQKLFVVGSDCLDPPGCYNLEMRALQYTVPHFFSSTALATVLGETERWTYQQQGHLTAFDPSSGRYFVLIEDDSSPFYPAVLYRLFTIQTLAPSSPISNVTLTPALSGSRVTSLQFDSSSGTLFAVVDAALAALDPASGALSQLGPLLPGASKARLAELQPSYPSTFDPATGTYFLLVLDLADARAKLLSYDTRAQQATLSGPIAVDAAGFQAVPCMINFYAPTGQIVSLASSFHEGLSIQSLSVNGSHVDLLSAVQFAGACPGCSVARPTAFGGNQMSFIDPSTGYFWFNVLNPAAGGASIQYFNLNTLKKTLSAPTSFTADNTGYAFFLPSSSSSSSTTTTSSTSSFVPIEKDENNIENEIHSTTTTCSSFDNVNMRNKHIAKFDPTSAAPPQFALSTLGECLFHDCKDVQLQLAQLGLSESSNVAFQTLANYSQLGPAPKQLVAEMGRLAAYDPTNATGAPRYFFLLDTRAPKLRHLLSVVTLGDLRSSLVPLAPSFDALIVSSMQYDPLTAQLYLVAGLSFYSVDPASGQGQAVAALGASPWVTPNWVGVSTLDAAGNYYASVYDLFDDSYRITAFNTVSRQVSLSPELGVSSQNDKAMYRALQWDPAAVAIVALADSPRWGGEVQRIDPVSWQWTALLSREQWPADLEVPSASRSLNQQTAYQPSNGALWMLLNAGSQPVITSYNVTKAENAPVFGSTTETTNEYSNWMFTASNSF